MSDAVFSDEKKAPFVNFKTRHHFRHHWAIGGYYSGLDGRRTTT